MLIHVIADTPNACRSISEGLHSSVRSVSSLVTKIPLRVISDIVIVSARMRCVRTIEKLQERQSVLRCAKIRIFLMIGKSRISEAQAYALGATTIVHSIDELNATLLPPDDRAEFDAGTSEATAAAGGAALKELFSSVMKRTPIDLSSALSAGAAIASCVAQNGLSDWLKVVRQHHEGTYQHCLLVTGVTVDFALHLGLNAGDVRRLYSAAMLHDIGKAVIPLHILDKPGRLDEKERTIVETHPKVGYDVLKNMNELSREILDGVLHHHEFLDGSGYPDGLSHQSIVDSVRILTISDIYSALIERRSYKEPMHRSQAYEILSSMSGKLEAPLIFAFKQVALYR